MKRMVPLVIVLSMSLSCIADISIIRNKSKTLVMNDNHQLLSTETTVFEPNWAWVSSKSKPLSQENALSSVERVYDITKSSGNLFWTETLNSVERGITWKISASTDKKIELTYAAFVFNIGDGLKNGRAIVRYAGGKTKQYDLPFPVGIIDDVEHVEFIGRAGEKLTLDIQPAVSAHIDKNIRFKLVESTLNSQSSPQSKFTLKSEENVRYYASPNEIPDATNVDRWFAFKPKSTVENNALSMSDWLSIDDQWVASKGDKLYAGKKELKFWGTNVEYSATKPEPDKAEQAAKWFAKYGVNLVRQHKLTNPGWEGLGSRKSASEYNREDLDRFDYFNAKLKENNIYYAFSPIWDLKVFPDDRKKLIAYDELVKYGGGNPNTRGLVWFMEDIQKLHIEALVNLVDHKNPYTKLRYADDPALLYVEIQNEEDVFFYTVMRDIAKYPTYKKKVAEQFSDWLKEKYGNEIALRFAWGRGWNRLAKEGAYKDESLSKRNIFPAINPWIIDNQGKDHYRDTRVQDTIRFLYESQNKYYAKAQKAIKDTGYKGMIMGSNWQAGNTAGHFLNLASDAKLDFIDRHNYLSGAEGAPGHTMETGFKFKNISSLDQQGSSLLSTGFQQVSNKPFMLSEWMAIPPHEWAAAETAIIAFYGLGLQGWDMSTFFASNSDGFTSTLEYPGNKKFNNQTAHGIGLFPLLSRAVLRGDIKEAEVIADRRLSVEQAIEQSYDFEHTTRQAHDLKSFSGTPGDDALAIGRVVVSFDEGEQTSRIEDVAKFRRGDTLVSTTGELAWTAPGMSETGHISVNTKGTQGVMGFAQDKLFDLAHVKITPKDHYSLVMMTAREQDKTLENCDQALLLAIARVRNSGMKLGHGMILDVGKGPQIIEPVRANIEFKRQPKSVIALDADGNEMGAAIALNGKTLALDTADHRAIYYLVQY